jgi:hypothetical protein
LGSSKTRTKEQEIKGRDLILQKITETTESTAIAFTDGSCLNNPVVYDVYACENSILYKYQVTLTVFYSYFLSTRQILKDTKKFLLKPIKCTF